MKKGFKWELNQETVNLVKSFKVKTTNIYILNLKSKRKEGNHKTQKNNDFSKIVSLFLKLCFHKGEQQLTAVEIHILSQINICWNNR